MEFKEELSTVFNNYNIKYSDKQLQQFEDYYNLIVEWNKKMNLTTILEQSDAIIKHFLDSVLICDSLKEDSKIIDVGAGAGLPSVPIKILRPDCEIVMVDGLNKRVTFLNEVINKLELKGISAIHDRCELLAHKPEHREQYDYAVARAVAETNVLSEYCLPFVKLFGYFIAYKSRNVNVELEKANNAITFLGGKVTEIKKFEIKEIGAERNFLFVQKRFKTPIKYPRGQNKPRLAPLE